jgi:hypothetical protein
VSTAEIEALGQELNDADVLAAEERLNEMCIALAILENQAV